MMLLDLLRRVVPEDIAELGTTGAGLRLGSNEIVL